MGVENKRTLTKTRRYRRCVEDIFPTSKNPSTDPLHRDIDQVKDDLLSPKHLKQYKDTKAPEDLPGLGKHYCTECAKWYDMEATLVAHRRGKPHKRRSVQARPLFVIKFCERY